MPGRYKKYYRRARKDLKSLTKMQKKGVARIAKSVVARQEELKQHAASIQPVNIVDNLGFFRHLTNPTQGLADTQRVGDSITVKSIKIRLNLYNSVDMGAAPWTDFRIIVFQYKSNDNTPQVGNLFLQSNANESTPAGNPEFGTYSPFNIDYVPRIYHILYDKHVRTEQGLNAAGQFGQTGKIAHTMFFKVPLKYCKRKIQFQGGGTTTNNGIWLYVTTGQTGAPIHTVLPSIKFDYNIRFTDA